MPTEPKRLTPEEWLAINGRQVQRKTGWLPVAHLLTKVEQDDIDALCAHIAALEKENAQMRQLLARIIFQKPTPADMEWAKEKAREIGLEEQT